MCATSTRGFPAAVDEVVAVPRAVWSLVPERLLRKHRAFPIGLGPSAAGRLLLAMADPGDLAAADEIAFASGLRVVAIPTSPGIVAQMIALHLGGRAETTGDTEAIDLPEDTGRHVRPEDWLIPTASGDTKWR